MRCFKNFGSQWQYRMRKSAIARVVSEAQLLICKTRWFDVSQGSTLSQRCIDSWKQNHRFDQHDFELIQWDELWLHTPHTHTTHHSRFHDLWYIPTFGSCQRFGSPSNWRNKTSLPSAHMIQIKFLSVGQGHKRYACYLEDWSSPKPKLENWIIE